MKFLKKNLLLNDFYEKELLLRADYTLLVSSQNSNKLSIHSYFFQSYIQNILYNNHFDIVFKHLYYIKRKIYLINKNSAVFLNYFDILSSAYLKNGKKIKVVKNINFIFYFLFSIFIKNKKNLGNVFFSSSNYAFFFFIKTFFLNNKNMLTKQSCL